MSPNWQSFLTNIHAYIENNHCRFDKVTMQNLADNIPDNFIAPLYQYGLLGIKGMDTAKFLQGQTTCDINNLSDVLSSFGAYCTPKGRMVTSFLIARENSEHYLLRMRRELVEASQQIFGRYIVFSKATQSDLSEDYIIFGLGGELAKTTINKIFQNCPTTKNAVVNLDGNLVIQLDDEGHFFECWVRSQEAAQYWRTLSADLTAVGSEFWALQTIRRGIGEVSGNTREMFIPQMLNFELTEHISFTKGCYTGQEIVARMHYRGKSKRRMYRAKVASTSIQDGDELYAKGTAQSVGTVVNHAAVDTGHSEILAVINNQATEDGEVLLGENKPILQRLSLPYAITNED